MVGLDTGIFKTRRTPSAKPLCQMLQNDNMTQQLKHLFFGMTIFSCHLSSHGQDISLRGIQGDWKCIYIECKKICESCCEDLQYREARIEEDSIFIFDYPHEYCYCSIISLDSNKSDVMAKCLRAKLLNDTLLVGGTDFYVRTTFENKIVSMLKKNSINSYSLIGKWKLVEWREMGYEGEENYDGTIHFPFKLPRILNINESTIKSPRLIGRYFKITVNGIERDFRIEKIDDYLISFSAGKWHKEKFFFEYRRKTK